VFATEYLLERAAECRAVAETLHYADLRRRMLIMADLFENLAIQARLIAPEHDLVDPPPAI